MPMTECFYTMNGQMMATDSGGVTKDFLTDHLGSVIAEVDQDENVTYRARYSALGQATSSTGTGCGFGWVGSYGYRETGLPHMSHYVRARHYSYITGGWSTVDPLWPEESAYGYVGGRSTAFIDPSGLQGPPPWWWPVTPDPGLGKPKLGPPKPTPGMPPPFPQPVYPPPTLPPPGQDPMKGCMGFNPSLNFWSGFKYGNCCGGTAQCPPKLPRPIPPGVGKPGNKFKVDCLDQACANHDSDIPSLGEYITPGPHATLCKSVRACDCASMYTFGSLDHQDCVRAKGELIVYACGSQLLFGGGWVFGKPSNGSRQ
jgi:RHS repeat-associated protein